MEDKQAATAMHAVLLASMFAVVQWAPMGLSSAEQHSQRCCEELDMLEKAFSQDEYECLVEDCVTWLSDMRTSASPNVTSCPVQEEALCENFAERKYSNMTQVPNRNWIPNADVTARNILRVVNTQGWQNFVIVYDVRFWVTVHLLTSFLVDRRTDYVIYDKMTLNTTTLVRNMLQEILGELKLRNIIILTDELDVLFQEAENYDRGLGRTSGLRMFTKWIVATSVDKEEQVARAATYFDNVVAVVEEPEVIAYNVSSTSKEVQCVKTDISTLMYVSFSNVSSDVTREFQSATALRPGDSDVRVTDAFPNVRHYFNRRTLTVGTKEWDPFVIKTLHNGTVIYSGLCFDLLNELAYYLNFTYIIVEPPFNEGWGDQNASGYWEGLVGQVNREEVDVVVAPLSFSIERALAMDSTVGYLPNRVAAVFKKPDPAGEKWRTFLRPFQGTVLLCLGATLVLVTGLVHAMSWMNPGSERLEEEADMEKKGSATKDKDSLEKLRKKRKHMLFPGPSADDGFWFLYGALVSQGGIRLPRSGSGRMLVASWWLFSIVMGATYSGNLVAFLTVQLETKPFNSLSDMLDQKTYQWGVLDKTVAYTMLTQSKNQVLRSMGDKLHEWAASDPEVMSLDSEVHMRKLMAGKYAFITDTTSTEVLVRKYCDLDQVYDPSSVDTPYTVNMPRGSAYTPLFDEYVLRILEAGLVYKWKRDWFEDENLCLRQSLVSDSTMITVLDIQSVFYVSLIGFALAVIALLVELCCYRHPKLRACFTSTTDEACGCSDEENKEEEGGHGGQRRSSKGGGDHFAGNDQHHHSNGDAGGSGRHGTSDAQFQSIFALDPFVGVNGDPVGSSGHVAGSAKTPNGLHSTPNGVGPRRFDFNSAIDRRKHFVFDTAYLTPEDFGRGVERYSTPADFGREASDVLHAGVSHWDYTATSSHGKPPVILDDVKIIT